MNSAKTPRAGSVNDPLSNRQTFYVNHLRTANAADFQSFNYIPAKLNFYVLKLGPKRESYER